MYIERTNASKGNTMPLKADAALRKDQTNAFASSMEHRHFATIAAILRDMPVRWGKRRKDIAEHFADRLATTNPRFDRSRFFAACGIAD